MSYSNGTSVIFHDFIRGQDGLVAQDKYAIICNGAGSPNYYFIFIYEGLEGQQTNVVTAKEGTEFGQFSLIVNDNG